MSKRTYHGAGVLGGLLDALLGPHLAGTASNRRRGNAAQSPSPRMSHCRAVERWKVPVRRNRFITITGADKSVNRTLEAKARALAGIKGYVTNLADPSPEFVIGAYHQLWHIEKSFRLSKHDLCARRSTTKL
jgi:hypothetical protein